MTHPFYLLSVKKLILNFFNGARIFLFCNGAVTSVCFSRVETLVGKLQ